MFSAVSNRYEGVPSMTSVRLSVQRRRNYGDKGYIVPPKLINTIQGTKVCRKL